MLLWSRAGGIRTRKAPAPPHAKTLSARVASLARKLLILQDQPNNCLCFVNSGTIESRRDDREKRSHRSSRIQPGVTWPPNIVLMRRFVARLRNGAKAARWLPPRRPAMRAAVCHRNWLCFVKSASGPFEAMNEKFSIQPAQRRIGFV